MSEKSSRGGSSQNNTFTTSLAENMFDFFRIHQFLAKGERASSIEQREIGLVGVEKYCRQRICRVRGGCMRGSVERREDSERRCVPSPPLKLRSGQYKSKQDIFQAERLKVGIYLF